MDYKHTGGNNMSGNILDGLNKALKDAAATRTNLLKGLNSEQVLIYTKFEKNLAELIKSGDTNGIEELKRKFNEEFNGKL